MGYAEKVLVGDERVIYRTHLHWIVFANAAWLAVACLGMYVLAASAVGSDPSFAGGRIIVGSVYLFVVMINAGAAFANRISIEIAVTTRRLLVKRGLIRPNAAEIASGEIEVITIEQTAIGHLLGYGTVVVVGTSARAGPLEDVALPLALRDAIARIRQTAVRPGEDDSLRPTEQDATAIAVGGGETELSTDEASQQVKHRGYAVVIGDGRFSVPVIGYTLFQAPLQHVIVDRNKSGTGMHCAARLLPKPTNPGHLDVVVVYIEDQEVGYLAPDFAPEFLRELGSGGYIGAACEALIVGGGEQDSGNPSAYVRLNARFPFRLQSAAEWSALVSQRGRDVGGGDQTKDGN
ncbi:MAG TPA: PH domain-containing protein [Rhizomicrobium sp.]|nr:PH domain-containing protein [Rhizomicrobium sp.]